MFDWVGLTSLVLAVAALLAVIWQIARTEGMRAPEAWAITVSRSRLIKDGIGSMSVTFRPAAGHKPSDPEIAVWGSAITTDRTGESRTKGSAISATVSWEAGDEEAYVGVTWQRPSYFRRQPLAAASRVSCSKRPSRAKVVAGHEVANPDYAVERWRWSVLQPLGRKPPRRGRWVTSKTYLKSVLPPDAAPDK